MEHHHMTAGEHSPKEIAKFIAVLLAIGIVSFLLNRGLSGFMGVFFIVFAGFKLAGYQMFVEMFPTYDVVAERWPVYAKLYPFLELLLGLLYLASAVPMVRDITTLILMGVSSIGVARELKRRRSIHCACLGNIIKLPLSTVSLVENVSMGLMALFMILA
jgi:hypothetical protein